MLPHPPIYVAPKAPTPPNLKSGLQDPAWKLAHPTPPFQDIEGPDKPKPAHPTTAKILWDDQNLYIAAELIEPHLWATYTEPNSIIYQENDFEWFIDPTGSHHNYFEWEVNALGTTMCLTLDRPYLAGGNYKFTTFPGLNHHILLNGTLNNPLDTDESWIVTSAIPWTVFNRPAPQPGDQWRISFSRVQWDLELVQNQYKKIEGRPEHNWTSTNQHDINMHRPWFWGYLQFEESAKTAPKIDPHHEAKMKLIEVFESRVVRKEKDHPIPPGVQLGTEGNGWKAQISSHGKTLSINHQALYTVQ